MIHWFQENIVTRCLDECYLEPLASKSLAGVSRWQGINQMVPPTSFITEEAQTRP